MGTNIDLYEEKALAYNPDNTLRVDNKRQFYQFRVKKNDADLSNLSTLMNVAKLKDYFYGAAIGNLYKKSKFLQLYIQLVEEQITEDEYELELKENAKSYFIEMKEMQSHLDYTALLQVLHNMPTNASLDDLSEILGIKINSLKEYLTLK